MKYKIFIYCRNLKIQKKTTTKDVKTFVKKKSKTFFPRKQNMLGTINGKDRLIFKGKKIGTIKMSYNIFGDHPDWNTKKYFKNSQSAWTKII